MARPWFDRPPPHTLSPAPCRRGGVHSVCGRGLRLSRGRRVVRHVQPRQLLPVPRVLVRGVRRRVGGAGARVARLCAVRRGLVPAARGFDGLRRMRRPQRRALGDGRLLRRVRRRRLSGSVPVQGACLSICLRISVSAEVPLPFSRIIASARCTLGWAGVGGVGGGRRVGGKSDFGCPTPNPKP